MVACFVRLRSTSVDSLRRQETVENVRASDVDLLMIVCDYRTSIVIRIHDAQRLIGPLICKLPFVYTAFELV